MKYLALIQARMGSSRLPGKVMEKVAGKPVVQWVLERVSKSLKTDEVMLITSIDNNNLPMVNFVSGLGYRIFIGSEEDVLDRYYQAAKLIEPEYVIRITADCPMFDWRYLDKAIEITENDPSIDYLGQLPNTFPDGLDIEIVKFSALREAWKEAQLKSEREHVTQYIIKRPERFQIYDFACPISGIGHHRWTLDESDDYTLVKKIYEHFSKSGIEYFITEDILAYLEKHPEISKINEHIQRNEGLAKSLVNDNTIPNTEEF